LPGELEEGKSYYLEITSGTLTDFAMNPYAGMHAPEDWTFRTRDERPRYTSLFPKGSGQALTTDLQMGFSEAVQLGTGHLVVHEEDGRE
ncbi:hypothetical protein Q8I65_25815, partial [Paenibacillus ottowii]|uniref:hypothetical protein n=1 Tax=Paenibacillus ottowii TaxID=2315729 RepID=UPI002731FE97